MSSASIAFNPLAKPCGFRARRQQRSLRGRMAVRMEAKQSEHVVQEGEWFMGISQKYAVSFDDLKSLNPGIDYDTIVPGQSIVLPENAKSSNNKLLWWGSILLLFGAGVYLVLRKPKVES